MTDTLNVNAIDGGSLTLHFGFDLGDPLGKLLLEVERLQPLLVVVYPVPEGGKRLPTWSSFFGC